MVNKHTNGKVGHFLEQAVVQHSPFLRDLIANQAEKWGDKTFLYFEEDRFSFRDLDRISNKLANGLIALGSAKGEKVCIMLPNHPDFIISWFALAKTGGVMVPVNTSLKGEGLAYIIGHCEAETIIISYQYWEQFKDLMPQLDKVKRVIVSTSEAPQEFTLPEGTTALKDLYSDNETQPDIALSVEDMAKIIYTSGTTGLPKGVVQFQSIPILEMLPWRYSPEDIAYTCLPLFHGNAMMLTTQTALMVGASVALGRRFSASKFWDETSRYKATWTSFLGAMIPILYKQPPKENDADNPIKFAISAAVPKDIWQDFEKRFGLRLLEGYAAVDGAGMLYNDDGRPGSIGKPVFWCECKVVDDNGQEVGPNTVGELLTRIKGNQGNMVVYFKNEEATRSKNSEGWVWTGDYVYYDAEGYYYFVDRKKDAMRRRGENISTWEVEKVISQHPEVLEAAVFGVPSELGEDDVMAIIVPQPGKKPDPMDIIRWCEERMAYFMVPRYLEFFASLEKTGTHRVQKVELKRRGVTENTWDLEKTGYKVAR